MDGSMEAERCEEQTLLSVALQEERDELLRSQDQEVEEEWYTEMGAPSLHASALSERDYPTSSGEEACLKCTRFSKLRQAAPDARKKVDQTLRICIEIRIQDEAALEMQRWKQNGWVDYDFKDPEDWKANGWVDYSCCSS